MKAKTKQWDLSHFPVELVQVARENDLLYDRFGVANQDDAALVLSIDAEGIQEPLVLSADHILLSGHRRFSAAKYLRLKTVPVRVVDLVYGGLTTSQRTEALRTHNRQREKSPGERIREALLDIDPVQAHHKLILRRTKVALMSGAVKSNVQLGAVKTRAAITTIKFLAATTVLIEENRVSVRIHDDKTGRSRRILVRFTLKRHAMRLQLTL